jgi:predicted RNase H-like nuclease (RuvC/YqgF family)
VKIGDIVATAISGILLLGICGGIFWLLDDWRDQRVKVYSLRSEIMTRDKTLSLKDETIAAYREAVKSLEQNVNTWKDHYEQLRWQLRTKPPTERR